MDAIPQRGFKESRKDVGVLKRMAEKSAPVFVVATANDVSQLPPELLRKGRWDEMFFVDLPNQEERQEIWRIQVAKHGRDWKDYDVAQLAKATEGLTGSEIEAVFVESSTAASMRIRNQLTDDHFRG